MDQNISAFFNEPPVARINSEPPGPLGIGVSEFTTLCVISIIFWIPALPFFIAIGLSLVSPLIWLVGVLVTVVLAAKRLRVVKRNRPDRYYMHASWFWFATRIPAMRGLVVLRAGPWATGRAGRRRR